MTRPVLWFGCVLLSAPASAQVVRVSASTAGTQANGPSDSPGISGDGRFVVFASAADNLVAGDTNVLPDIFLRDRDRDADGVFDEVGAVATTRLNLGPGGVQADNASSDPVITPDARFVCFVSKATNLVAGVTPIAEVLQVYRLDLLDKALKCSLAAKAAGKAFRIVVQHPSIDSWSAFGLIGSGSEAIRRFRYDSAPCGGPGCAPRFDVETCETPTVRRRAGEPADFGCAASGPAAPAPLIPQRPGP